MLPSDAYQLGAMYGAHAQRFTLFKTLAKLGAIRAEYGEQAADRFLDGVLSRLPSLQARLA